MYVEAEQCSVYKHTIICIHIMGISVIQETKNPPVNAGVWVQSLDQEKPLEKESLWLTPVFLLKSIGLSI